MNNCEYLTEKISCLLKRSIDFIKIWRKENPNRNEDYDIAQAHLQMITGHIYSILKLSEGFKWSENTAKVIDISSLVSVLRTLYERVFIFRNLFIMPDNEIEREILICIWKIWGLNNRITIGKLSNEYKDKQEEDKELKEELQKRVSTLIAQLDIDHEIKTQILHASEKNSGQLKGLFFKKENGKIKGFQSIPLIESVGYVFKDAELDCLYTYLSFHSHPSYLGLMAFGSMYSHKGNIEQLSEIVLSLCYHLLSIAIKDFCLYTNSLVQYYDKLYALTVDPIIEETKNSTSEENL